MSKPYLSTILLAGAMIGCSDEVTSERKIEEKTEARIIRADSINSIPLETLKGFASYSGQSEITKLVRYGVTTYKVIYSTSYKGTPINASGLLYVPQSLTSPAPLVSLQHGTTFLKNNAPSTGADFTGMEYFAAAGYIAIMPDFIGYGESADVFHPYYDEKHSASSVIDFIKASKEFLSTQKITFNDQLFLAGYSEGGYVTLAAAHELDKNKQHGLTVTAVAAGAGGYDLREMLTTVTTKSYYAYPAYLAFVLAAYNETYGWNKPLSYFFQEKYARVLDTYLNGEYDGWQINSKLTTDTKALLNPTFYANLKKEEGEPELKQALNENSIDGWETTLPIKLYHGKRDEIIPFQNSEATLREFHAKGSKQVELTLFPDGTHGSAFVPMLKQFVPWFESFRKQ